MRSIRVFNFDIAPGAVVGVFDKTQMTPGPWNVYFAGDNEPLTRCYIVDSADPESAKFPFQAIWITDGSEIYILNDSRDVTMCLQVLFTPVVTEMTAPTQETQSA